MFSIRIINSLIKINKHNFKTTHIFKHNFRTLGSPSGDIKLEQGNYKVDDFTNVTYKIFDNIDRKLFMQKHHPLNIIKQRIVNYMYYKFISKRGTPLFSVHETLSPIVTLEQNFDQCLIPKDHPSRSKSDNYYVNSQYVLRAHTSAHQSDLIKSGLNNFLVVGDVYRRDEIDSTHYPIFHQMEAVRLCNDNELFKNEDLKSRIFENGEKTEDKQAAHTLEATKLMETDLKSVLEGLVKELFGAGIETKWVATTFPFTHPSWELEIFYNNKWLEVLGCGIMQHTLVQKAGCENRIGWAFGLGLERLAMILFQIPDIRLFWSNDSGFLSQFVTDDINAPLHYVPISRHPQCINDMSFWVTPEFKQEDYYDIIRDIGGDIIEQVKLIDKFTHPKHGRTSHCYQIIYRHMERTLVQTEVNALHAKIADAARSQFNIEIR